RPEKERPPDLTRRPGAQVTVASPGIFWGAVGADPRLAVGLLQLRKGTIPGPYGGSKPVNLTTTSKAQFILGYPRYSGGPPIPSPGSRAPVVFFSFVQSGPQYFWWPPRDMEATFVSRRDRVGSKKLCREKWRDGQHTDALRRRR